jgi:hypothetical protein
VRAEIAKALRHRAASVTSQYRRDGVLLAASWIDPDGETRDSRGCPPGLPGGRPDD